MLQLTKALATLPAEDGNFKASLHYASVQELEEAVRIMQADINGHHKSRIAACQRELRKRGKNNEKL